MKLQSGAFRQLIKPGQRGALEFRVGEVIRLIFGIAQGGIDTQGISFVQLLCPVRRECGLLFPGRLLGETTGILQFGSPG